MSKKAIVTIVLEYTDSQLMFMNDRDFPPEDFLGEVEEQAYQDLRNYLMSEPIRDFATIEIEDN